VSKEVAAIEDKANELAEKLIETMSQSMNEIFGLSFKGGVVSEQSRILSLIDQLIHDTEDCPLYEGEEREWLIGAYYTVRRLVSGTDTDIPGDLD
jgi:hypothetical protein